MEIVGLQASPRKKGNSDRMLEIFMQKAHSYGARTAVVQAARLAIKPCRELTVCEKKGTCPLNDHMESKIYGLLRRAEIVVVSSPVFFYNVPAQFKALIDRCQPLWARKYRLGLRDPKAGQRKGFLLAVGATSGARLFEGLELTIRYFFDAIDAAPAGNLTYKGIEKRGQIMETGTIEDDLDRIAGRLCGPFQQRAKVLVLGDTNSVTSKMAAAFLQAAAGKRLDVISAGLKPAVKIDSRAAASMAELGIDIGFQLPRSVHGPGLEFEPDYLITTGPLARRAEIRAGQRIDWNFGSLADKAASSLNDLRDRIKTRTEQFLAETGNHCIQA